MRKQKWRKLLPLPKGLKVINQKSRDSNPHNLTLEPGLFQVYNYVTIRAGNTDFYTNPFIIQVWFSLPEKLSAEATLLFFKYF